MVQFCVNVLLSEILTKKPQQIYQKELEQEKNKVIAVSKVL
jgi:hypothetical protein